MKILKVLASTKDKINEYRMKRDLVRELNKFVKQYKELPNSIQKLNPKFHNILKVIDFGAVDKIPVKSITVTIPYWDDKSVYKIDLEAEDGSIIDYVDWRDYETYEANVERKSEEMSSEEMDREKEYISSLKHMLEIHEDNLNKIIQRREQHLANKKNKKWKKSK